MSSLDAAEIAAEDVYGRAEVGSDLESLADALCAVIEVLRGFQERLTERAETVRALDKKIDSMPGTWGDGT